MTTMRRARARPRARRNPRAKVSWENLAFTANLTAAVNIVIADLTPEPIQTVTGDVGTATLRRAIMHFDLSQDAVGDNNVNIGTIGIYVAGHEGFDQNAVSDPEGDFFQDWYYWTRRAIMRDTAGEAAMVSWDADIRSMRKLRGGYKLVMVVTHPLNGNPLELRTSMRLLWSQSP